VYDPQVSRFLSPDPLIQAPGYTQSFNRYAYGWNNPLWYTDPTGYFNTEQHNPGNYNPDPEVSNFWTSGFHNFGMGGHVLAGGGSAGNIPIPSALPYGLPGKGDNGPGNEHGIYYDWVSGTYRSVLNPSRLLPYGRWVDFGYADEKGVFVLHSKLIDYNSVKRRERGQGGRDGLNVYTGNNPFYAAYYHYQFGRRKDFHMSTSALDFSGINMQTPEIQQIVRDGGGYINLLTHFVNQTSLTIGSVYFVYLGNNSFSLRSDEYDFDIRWGEGFSKRNILTLCAGLLHGPVIDNKPVPMPFFPVFGPSVYTRSGPFRIYFVGTVTLNP
jgi:hypothetical protein